MFGNQNKNNSTSLFGNNNNTNTSSLFGNINNNNNSNVNNQNQQNKSLFGNNSFSLFGQKIETNQNNQNNLFIQNNNTSSNQSSLFTNSLFNNGGNSNTSLNQTSSLFGSINNGIATSTFQNNTNNIQQNENNNQNKSIFENINNNNNDKELLNLKLDKKPKSLSRILFDRMQENNEYQNLSYNSEYIQEKQEEEEKKNINKYKNISYEISSPNNLNINPVLKNNVMTIKEYFNKSGNKFKRKYRLANSFDMSFNLESKVLTNLENSFSNKLSFNNEIGKNDKKKITMKCIINEPHKASFTVIVGKKVEISKLKMTICEQLGKKNKIYSSLKPNSFCLMKNYLFIQEFGTVGDTILSDGDNIYIILKDSMKKAQLNE